MTQVALVEQRRIEKSIKGTLVQSTTYLDGSTTHALNSSSKYCVIEIVGGGGGGSTTSNAYFGAGGGGGGAYAEFSLDLLDANFLTDNGNVTTLYFSVAATIVANVLGQSTIFKVSPSTTVVTAVGGSQGSGTTGGAGGTVTWVSKSYIYRGKDIPGGAGTAGVGSSGSAVTTESGVGGSSYLGSGGQRRGPADLEHIGLSGSMYGGGGEGGERRGAGVEFQGGDGARGKIVIHEFS